MKYSEESKENWRLFVSCRIKVGMPGVVVPLLGQVFSITLEKILEVVFLQSGMKKREFNWLDSEKANTKS